MSKKLIYLISFVLLLGVLQAVPAEAQSVVFEFGGIVTDVQPGLDPPWDQVNVNDQWSIVYTFDPTTADSTPLATRGDYYSTITCYTLRIGSGSDSSSNPSGVVGTRIKVFDNLPPDLDQYEVGINLGGQYDWYMDMHGPNTIWDTDELPLCGDIELSDFSGTRNFQLTDWDPFGGEINGSVDYHRCWYLSPSDGATCVDPNVILSWPPGCCATSYDVYFGADETAVTNATVSSPEFKGNQTALTYPLTGLIKCTTYYWRIDEVCEDTLVAVPPDPAHLLAYYKFEDNADDSSSNGFNGTVNGNPTYEPGVYGQAISLDGDGDYVDLGNPAALNFGTGDWTVSMWIKTTESDKGVPFANGGGGAGGIRYALGVGESQNDKITLTVDDDQDRVQAHSSTNVTDGEWHCVVGVRDGDTLRVYVDCELEATAGLPAGYDLSGTDQHNALIGAIWNRGTNTIEKFYTGLIDDLRIYDYALSHEEVRYVCDCRDLIWTETYKGEVWEFTTCCPSNIKWSQPPDETPTGMDIRIVHYSDIFPAIADDFECNQPGPITDVHFWGSWKDDVKGDITKIHLSIHKDIPADPCAPDSFSKPGDLLWRMDFDIGEFTETLYADLSPETEWWWYPWTGELDPNGDSQIWRYDIYIDPNEAFVQEGTSADPEIYWLAIYVDTDLTGQYPFGWKTSTKHWNDDAVYWAVPGVGMPPPFELRYPAGHPYEGMSIDMAFAITTEPIVDPNEACCFDDGSCQDLIPDECIKEEGTPQGASTNCASTDCPCDILEYRCRADVKWSQPPRVKKGIINGWDELSSYDNSPIVADDWLCKDERPIKDFHWWGSFKGWTECVPPEEMPDAFHIGIWTDVPDPDPYDLYTFSHPGELVWEKVSDCYVWSFAGYDLDPRGIEQDEACFKFDQLLSQDEWFYQDPNDEDGTVYWLSIAAIYDDGSASCWLVDDFESYTDTPDLLNAWQALGAASLFLSKDPNPHHFGDQAMGFTYANNYIPYYSEGAFTPAGKDWTAGGVKKLSLWFKGETYNPVEQMYVALEDTLNVAVVKHDDGYAVTTTSWQQWCIDLTNFTGVNLANVDKLYIGFGDRYSPSPADANGTVYIDDIRLCNECPNEPNFPWGWKTRPHFYGDDAVRIATLDGGEWPLAIGSVWESGEPIQYPAGTSWDMAFVLTANRKYMPRKWWWPHKSWTVKEELMAADIYEDGRIDFKDLAVSANHWLEEAVWP